MANNNYWFVSSLYDLLNSLDAKEHISIFELDKETGKQKMIVSNEIIYKLLADEELKHKTRGYEVIGLKIDLCNSVLIVKGDA